MARKMFFVWLLILGFGCGGSESLLPKVENIWAVLVAGSNGYENYRHQADVCHAYHVLREHGVPASNIIVMMYDDIAYNEMNPRKGVIINAVNGTNVYEGVVRDYIGKDVNSTNFLKIIKGDEEGMRGIGSGRVLKSGPRDHVFINFADHGADGLLCFPNDELYAPDFINSLVAMRQEEMFAKMVIYVEACESGSMFDIYSIDNLNIFAVSAAKRGEDSFACCWDSSVQAYLGDVFSVNWMDDSDAEDLRRETLNHQFEIVFAETNTSSPQEYGDLTIARMHVGQFMGEKKFPRSSRKTSRCDDVVSSRDVPLAVLQRQLEETKSPEKRTRLKFQIHRIFKLRHSVDKVVNDVLSLVFDGNLEKWISHIKSSRGQLSRATYHCYRQLVQHWFTQCYHHSTSPYALRKLPIFANICTNNIVPAERVLRAMDIVCQRIEMKDGIL